MESLQQRRDRKARERENRRIAHSPNYHRRRNGIGGAVAVVAAGLAGFLIGNCEGDDDIDDTPSAEVSSTRANITGSIATANTVTTTRVPEQTTLTTTTRATTTPTPRPPAQPEGETPTTRPAGPIPSGPRP